MNRVCLPRWQAEGRRRLARDARSSERFGEQENKETGAMKHWQVLLAVVVVSGLMTAGANAGLCGSVACGPGEGNPPIDPADIGGATYIEAGHGPDGNTVDAATGSVDGWLTSNGGSWANRADLSKDLYVDSFGAQLDGNMLKTTVSVPLGTYEVFGLYETHWDINPPINVSDSRQIEMGFSANSLSSYSLGSGTQVPGEAIQGQATEIVSLGTLTDVTEISVYIDDSINPDRGRTGYRGIAYLIPEPAAGLLLAVGATLLVRRRHAD